MTNMELYDKKMAELQAIAVQVRDTLGLQSIQICATVHMQQEDETAAIWAGAGSLYERIGTTREFVLRLEEQTREGQRNRL